LTSRRAKYDGAIEFRRLDVDLEPALTEFLLALVDAGDTVHFQPHPFTAEYVATLARHTGDDLYFVLTEANRILAYGMLRGWDEGFSIPSLGIAVHPAARGSGLGRLMMRFLHAAAKRRSCSSVRLRVAVENRAAATLYESLGYRFTRSEDGYRIGFIELGSGRADQV
jgi:[ribosomal protein S18]-alanine N-acetyltransferase